MLGKTVIAFDKKTGKILWRNRVNQRGMNFILHAKTPLTSFVCPYWWISNCVWFSDFDFESLLHFQLPFASMASFIRTPWITTCWWWYLLCSIRWQLLSRAASLSKQRNVYQTIIWDTLTANVCFTVVFSPGPMLKPDLGASIFNFWKMIAEE